MSNKKTENCADNRYIDLCRQLANCNIANIYKDAPSLIVFRSTFYSLSGQEYEPSTLVLSLSEFAHIRANKRKFAARLEAETRKDFLRQVDSFQKFLSANVTGLEFGRCAHLLVNPFTGRGKGQLLLAWATAASAVLVKQTMGDAVLAAIGFGSSVWFLANRLADNTGAHPQKNAFVATGMGALATGLGLGAYHDLTHHMPSMYAGLEGVAVLVTVDYTRRAINSYRAARRAEL